MPHVSELRQKLNRCAVHGENFTLLLMGPPGSDKGLVLESAIQAANNDTNGAIEVVHVDAPMHKDDACCVRAIVSQLSHLFGCLPQKKRKTFQENLTYLQALLRDSWSLKKAVVIALNHFERFCGQGRQSLLYCLFDLLHVPNLQMCVIGVTSVLNVTDNLEKRIKSRCSLQRVYVTGPRELDEIIANVKRDLQISVADFPLSLQQEEGVQSVADCFNAFTETLLSEDDTKELWELEFAAGRDSRWFLKRAAMALLALTPRSAAYGEAPSTPYCGNESQIEAETHVMISKPIEDTEHCVNAETQTPAKKRRSIAVLKEPTSTTPSDNLAKGAAPAFLSMALSMSTPPEEAYAEQLMGGLGTYEHVVLGAMSRLYSKQMVPKTFSKIFEEVATYRHAPKTITLRKAFIRLLEHGIIEQTAYRQCDIGGQYTGIHPLGDELPCRFRAVRRYRKLLRTFRLQTELQLWIENPK